MTRKSQYRKDLDLKLDTLRPRTPVCPWCGEPGKRPKTFKNGSREAKRLLRKGKVRIVDIPRADLISFTRTVCAHGCHLA